MTFPLTRSRSRARFFGVPFSPATLFANGEQGAWYDPSDGATIFEDRAGTTPCRVPGAGSGPIPVGLMLDKSQGLVLGPELVTNGTFASGTTGWTLTGGGTFTASNGIARLQNPTTPLAEATVYATITTVVGRWYTFVFTLAGSSAGQTLSVRVGTSAGGTQNATNTPVAAGTYRVIFAATATTTFITLNQNTNAADVWSDWDNISVRELPGNHAIAANDTTARPELSARVNLLTYSEQFDNAAWSKAVGIAAFGSGSVVDATTAPDGTTTADLVTTATTNSHYINSNNNISVILGVTYTYSVYLKKGSGANAPDWVTLFFNSAGFGATYIAAFNLTTMQVGATGAGLSGTPTITDVGNGWRRCVIQAAATATSLLSGIGVGFTNNANTASLPSYAALSGENVFIWGADLRVTNIGANLPAYQRVVDQYTYDNAGFPVRLLANGTSTAMSTGAINFTATDKMTVFAGVRKESASGRAMLTELSVSAANQGTFNVTAPEFTDDYSFLLTGNAGSPYYQPAGYAAPITNVLACAYDFSGALRVNEIVPRINGVLAQSGGVGTAAGTNTSFLSAPLYLFARNNSSLFFNGSLYSLIVRGAQSTAGEISATEQWVANKTGVTI